MNKMKKFFFVMLIMILCMTSFSFASGGTITPYDENLLKSTASSGTLIRMGTNYQLYDGVPSAFQNLTWSSWATHSMPIDATDAFTVALGGVSLVKSKVGGIWGLIGLTMLTNDLNEVMGEVFFQNVVNNAIIVSGKKTAYARAYESFAQSASGTLQYSKVYVRYFKDSTYSTPVGTTNTLCLYAWPTGAKSIGN